MYKNKIFLFYLAHSENLIISLGIYIREFFNSQHLMTILSTKIKSYTVEFPFYCKTKLRVVLLSFLYLFI